VNASGWPAGRRRPARNFDIGTALTAAALLRVRKIAAATETPDFRDGPPGEDEALAGLGDLWVDAAVAIHLATKDPQSTQDVMAAALNRKAREARDSHE
jgi:hypothetical protein